MTIPQDVAADPWQIVADLQQRIAASHAEREAVELALRESEERYSLAMRAINEGFYEWDVATSQMRYSPRVCELVGLAPEELRTMTDWTDRIHPTDMPEFRKAILAHFNGETEWLEAEYRYRHADGTWHWARQHGIGLRNDAGRVYRVVGSTGDISAQKAAEEALLESLEQQTATAEVLQVINASPGDLAPVFGAILDKAYALCGAAGGDFLTFDGEFFRSVATRGMTDQFTRTITKQPYRLHPDNPANVLVRSEQPFVHVADLAEVTALLAADPMARAAFEEGGVRTVLMVPLRKDNNLLGIIVAQRREVRPFTDKQIALLQNFAAQAVIAMENARLLTETREALEQQTATAEVLQVINSSPGDLAPVFDAMLEKAHRLCGATHGLFGAYDGERFRALATRGIAPSSTAILSQPFYPPPGSPHERLLRGEQMVHIADLAAETEWERDDPKRHVGLKEGIGTALFVPLRKDGRLVGYLSADRQEVKPFAEREIALLQSFAAQAVIAMENARLLGELRERTGDLEESLQYQTATSDVLQVISRSTFDLEHVFATLVETAARLCAADMASVQRRDGEVYPTVAHCGFPPEFAAWAREHPQRADRASIGGRAILDRRIIHVSDLAADPEFGWPEAARRFATRSVLAVPLMREGEPLGAISLMRRRVEPFTERQIELVRTFADQAVIAMENARLLTETRDALAQQTATAEVLQVINSSPGDLTPVFDAIVEKAHTLCAAASGSLQLWDGQKFRGVAIRGFPEAMVELLRAGYSPSGLPCQRIVEGERVVHCADLAEITREGGVKLGGVRTILYVALRKDDVLLGQIVAVRQQVRPFSEKEIALVENFAAQAVIAMENARLLTETREALEQQTATAEVLRVINSSPGDLMPVFETILDKAHALCGAELGTLFLYDGEKLRAAATHGYPEDLVDELRRGVDIFPNSGPAALLAGARLIHRPDITQSGDPVARAVSQRGGVRTNLLVPLRKDGVFLGQISCNRKEVRPYTDKEIGLIENFAAQAVIAIENARLLDEIRQRQAELRVTFDNMVDGVAMFDEALHLAAWNRNFQELLDLPDDFLAERHGFDEFVRYLTGRGEFGETDPETEINRLRGRIGDHYSFERTRPDGTVIEVRHNPMPDGGVVLIYSDITERKRSEAEIHAARDAAEAAYRDLKAAQASLIQAEKMASLGQLTAGIAHEIKNPLNFVNNFAGLSVELLDELKETASPVISALDDERRAEIDETINMLSGNLDKIAEHGRRADGIVTSMLEHSRGSSGERRSVDLNALIEEALNLAYHGGRAQDQSFNITLERNYAHALGPIELVPQDITRVCLNLFSNGFYAATRRQKQTDDPKFKPTLKVTTRDLGDAVEINIRDNGVGIPLEIKDKLFEPFFTTKPTGEGTGLGLSICYDIVTQEHGGTISADSQIGEFTEFTVRLPRTFGATIAQAAS